MSLSAGTVGLLQAILRDLIEDQARAPGARRSGQRAWAVDQLRRAQAELGQTAAGPRAARGGRSLRLAVAQPDADGCDLKPDPALARTPAALMDTLRAFRTWAGSPSYRGMAATGGGRFAHTTLHAALNSSDLPDLFMMRVIITGCGGTSSDVARFTTAWRRVKMRPAAALAVAN